jgi:hypothetical protein
MKNQGLFYAIMGGLFFLTAIELITSLNIFSGISGFAVSDRTINSTASSYFSLILIFVNFGLLIFAIYTAKKGEKNGALEEKVDEGNLQQEIRILEEREENNKNMQKRTNRLKRESGAEVQPDPKWKYRLLETALAIAESGSGGRLRLQKIIDDAKKYSPLPLPESVENKIWNTYEKIREPDKKQRIVRLEKELEMAYKLSVGDRSALNEFYSKHKGTDITVKDHIAYLINDIKEHYPARNMPEGNILSELEDFVIARRPKNLNSYNLYRVEEAAKTGHNPMTPIGQQIREYMKKENKK